MDIMNIKKAVKNGEIHFEVANGNIFCFDNVSGEIVLIQKSEKQK